MRYGIFCVGKHVRAPAASPQKYDAIGRYRSTVSAYLKNMDSFMWANEKRDVWKHSESVEKATESIFSRPSTFVGAAADEIGCNHINDSLPEVAFSGRSNVGKSTLLATILGLQKKVRISSKPGHTKGVNFFTLGQGMGEGGVGAKGERRRRRAADPHAYLVDLPGYGFARGSKSERKAIEDRSIGYALGRDQTLRTKMFVLIDARRGIMPIDRQVLTHYDDVGVNTTIVLTKIDSLRSQDELRKVLTATASELSDFAGLDPYVHFVSAIHGIGIRDLRRSITRALFPGL